MATKKGRRPLSSARHRGDALAFIKAHPWALTKDVLVELEWEHETGSKRLQRMCALKELKREPVTVKQETSNRIVRTYKYFALVDEIFPPEEVERILAALAQDKEAEGGKEPEPLPPGCWRNDDPKRMAIKGQGGQGASHPRCCSAISQLE